MHRPALLLSAALAALGCGNTDTAVFVEAHILQPSTTVGANVFGTNLSGSFDLELHLGARASDTSHVTVRQISLQSADQSRAIVSPLPAAAKESSPFAVELDSTRTIAFAFDTGNKPLPPSVKGDVCGAGGLRIAVILQDSLQTSTTPATSEPFQPSGCK